MHELDHQRHYAFERFREPDVANHVAADLLQEAELDSQNKKWAQAIDTAARDAARINREIRKILNSES